MKTFVDKVKSAVPPYQEAEALISQCEKCGSVFFGVFQIKGHDHFHLQCAQCGASYCPHGGTCHQQALEQIIPDATIQEQQP